MNPNQMQPQTQYKPPSPNVPQVDPKPTPQAKPPVDSNKAGANLGFVNTLQEHLLQYKANQDKTAQPSQSTPQQTPTQSPQGSTPNPLQGIPSNQQTPTDTASQIEGLESRMMDELQTLKVEIQSQKDGKKEFDDLKKQIETVLNSND